MYKRKPLSKMRSFKPTYHSAGNGFSRESGGAHYVQCQQKCCSESLDMENDNRVYAELARCHYLCRSVDNELSVDEVFLKY